MTSQNLQNKIILTLIVYPLQSLEDAQLFSGAKTTKYLSMNCLMGLYVPLLFTKGYDFPNDTQNILAVRDIAGEKPGEQESMSAHKSGGDADMEMFMIICNVYFKRSAI